MLYKLSTLVALVPFVSALTLNTPTDLSSGGTTTISWNTAEGDPDVFSLEFTNTEFHDTFAIANNVQASSGSTTIELPAVPPGDGYTLEAVDISNVNHVFAQTGGFSIAPPVSSSVSPSSTRSVSSATGSSSVGSVSATSSGQSSRASSSSSSSSSGSASASSPTSSITNFNAATGLGMNTGAMGAMVLGAIAGAAVIAL